MTTPQAPEHLADDWSWANPTLKEQLERDPAAVLKDRGIDVPEGFPSAVVRNSSASRCFCGSMAT